MFNRRSALLAVVGGSALCAFGGTASAAVVHQYTFNNGTVNDSVGAASGATLPATLSTGITGDFTIEQFVTIAGQSALTTNFSIAKDTTHFILVNPSTNGGAATAVFDDGGTPQTLAPAAGTVLTAAGTSGANLNHMVAITYQANTGNVALYLDGVSLATGTLVTKGGANSPFSSTATTNLLADVIGANTGVNDDSPTTTTEFRVLNNVQSPAQVAADFSGPTTVGVPEPASLGLLGLGGPGPSGPSPADRLNGSILSILSDGCCRFMRMSGSMRDRHKMPGAFARRLFVCAVRLFFCPLLTCLACTSGSAGCNKADPGGAGPVPGQWFEDVTDKSGVHFVHDAGPADQWFMPEVIGSGAALFDFDNKGDQGRLGLYLVQNGGAGSKSTNKLFRQNGDGTFSDVSAGSGLDVAGYGMGVAVGDVNNDGLPDVLVTEYGGVRLFLNKGNGKFTDVTARGRRCATRTGRSRPPSSTTTATAGSTWSSSTTSHYDPALHCPDASGRPDYCGPRHFPGTVTQLFHNLGRAEGRRSAPVRGRHRAIGAGLPARPRPGRRLRSTSTATAGPTYSSPTTPSPTTLDQPAATAPSRKRRPCAASPTTRWGKRRPTWASPLGDVRRRRPVRRLRHPPDRGDATPCGCRGRAASSRTEDGGRAG